MTYDGDDPEVATIGSMLIDPLVAYQCAAQLTAEDFTQPLLADVFRLVTDAMRENSPIDLVTLAARAKKKGLLRAGDGVKVIKEIMEVVPTAANGEYYAKIVKENAGRRRLRALASSFACAAADETLSPEAVVVQFTNDARKALGSTDAKCVSLAQALDDAVKDMNDTTGTHRLLTGLTDFDSQFGGGFPRKGVTIVGARPSVGKTPFALQFVLHQVLSEGRSAIVYSLERDSTDIASVLLTQASRVSLDRLQPGVLRSAEEEERISAGIAKLSYASDRLRISGASRVSPMTIRTELARLPDAERPEIVVVDYLGLLDAASAPGGKNRTRENEISYLSREMKMIQQEFGIALIVCAQLNRQSVGRVGDNFPRISDLRDSGAIEQDADMIVLLHRPAATLTDPDQRDAAGNTAHLIVGKNRRGPTGEVKVAFNGPAQTFENLASYPWE